MSDGTYYDLPILKPPAWKAYVPIYFWAGGAAGAASLFGAAALLAGGKKFARLSKAASLAGALGGLAGSALLTLDLGRPSRFIKMLRVFRPTSPMNVGSWILSAFSAANFSAVLFERTGFEGAAKAAKVAAGVLGVPMSGYTAVLLANTAVPAWADGRHALPPLFVASAMSSAADVLGCFPLGKNEARAVQIFGTAGKAAELAASFAYAHTLEKEPRVKAALEKGPARPLMIAARVLTAASLVVAFAPGKQRWKKLLSAALGTAGALSLRFAITRAGEVSAKDPRALTEPQRAHAVQEAEPATALMPPSPVASARP